MTSLKSQRGMAALEVILVVVFIALIVGVGYWVYKQKPKSTTSTSTTTTASSSTAKPGTTQSIDQLTQQDASAESSIDTKHQGGEQNTATSANSAQSNLGGAYNESSF